MLVGALLLATTVGAIASAAAQSIVSGGQTLRFVRLDTGRFGLRISREDASGLTASQDLPAAVFVCAECSSAIEDTDPVAETAAYSGVIKHGDAVTATTTITAGHGSRFRFTDTYRANGQGFELRRTVTVEHAGEDDTGFSSQFSIGFTAAQSFAALHFFAPGIWYDHNTDAVPGAFGTDRDAKWTYWRETRSGLPLVMMQDDNSGLALSLAHIAPKPQSGADETRPDWITDATVQYGSLGVQKEPSTQIGFIFPANEGSGTYVAHRMRHWARRSHPVRTGFSHTYALTLRLAAEPASTANARFALALRDTWRIFYPVFIPPFVREPSDSVYADEIALVAHYTADRSGAAGLPFLASVPDGSIPPGYISYQMGFVGEQLPLGYQLLRYGAEHGAASVRNAGFAIVAFWATRAAQPNGLPLTWYNVNPPTFRDDRCASPIFLRTASDGMEGALHAAQYMRQLHQPVSRWETFVTAYGDWLVEHQNSDGSFYRAFNPDGSVFTNKSPGCNRNGFGTSKSNTTHPIRFLAELYFVSGNKNYLEAARKAGEYAYLNSFEKNSYVGGTPDNGNTIDKEAAVEALHAFLALYDLTADRKWLIAANAAADVVESWMYAWNFGLKNAPPDFAYAGEQGSGLIATGHSGADAFLNFEAYDMYRLHLFGDDANNHRLAVARYFANNGKMTTQLTGSAAQQFGDSLNGLLREASDFSYMTYQKPPPDSRPAGSNSWLPWLSEAEIEPLQLLLQHFHSTSIQKIEQQPNALRLRENTGTHPEPGTIGWGTRVAPR